MSNKGFANRAKSGQKALPARMKRVKAQVATSGQPRKRAERKRRRSKS